MADTMKITDKMADAIMNAQPTQTLEGERLKITSDVHDRVCAGLQDRGLVEYVKVTDTASRMALSHLGHTVKLWLDARPERRSFPSSVLDTGAEILAEQAEAVGETVPPAQSTMSGHKVKIWYKSGAYEECNHVEAGLALTIFAEAVGNDAVKSAELHRPDGVLAREFDNRAELDRADTVG